MALTPMEFDVASGWTTPTALTPKSGSTAVSNYGTMMASINKDIGMACLKWSGNSTAPTAGNYDFTLSSEYVPSTSYIVPIKSGSYMELRAADSVIRVSLTTATWSGGVLVYPL